MTKHCFASQKSDNDTSRVVQTRRNQRAVKMTQTPQMTDDFSFVTIFCNNFVTYLTPATKVEAGLSGGRSE